MKQFFSELSARLKSETPGFFVKLKYLGGSLATVGGSLAIIPNAPASIVDLGVHLMVAGGVMAAVSQLTMKSPDQK